MPDVDGEEVLREIRLTAQRLPVIIMTGFGTITAAVEAMKDGAEDFLIKALSLEALVPASSASASIAGRGTTAADCSAPGRRAARPAA